jgi:signal transduction histidine kinase/PAS domain-containing protein
MHLMGSAIHGEPASILAGGEMSDCIRAFDWTTSPLGPMDRWPRSLRTLVDTLLPHPLPMIVLWGPELIQIYNDGYAKIAVEKHPAALGMPTRQCWPELWHISGPIYERVLRRGESVLLEDQLFPVTRNGELNDAWFTVSFSPVRDDAGQIAGVFLTILETTEQKERVRTEEALHRSEQRYRTVFRSIDEGFCVIEVLFDHDDRPVDYRFIEVNDSFERQAGMHDVVGKRMLEFVPAIESHWLRNYGNVALTGQPVRLDGEYKGLDRYFDVYAFRAEGWPERHVAVLFQDVTERKNAELFLQASEQRQAFLLKLSDALRPLADPAAIQGEAARLLREHFAIGWCYYADFIEAGGVATVLNGAARDGLPSLAGCYDTSDVPEYVNFLRTGQLLNVPDVANYELLSPRIVEWSTALGIRAVLGVPLVKEDRLLSQLFMLDTVPRHWQQEAVEMIGEVAERTWAAVERARIEASLRELTQSLEQQVAERTAIAERRAHDLRRLTAELNEVEHRERKRLARLLHDSLQQLLVAARLRLPLDATADGIEREIQRVDQLLLECLATSRNLTQELSPPILEMGTLADVVQWLVKWCGEKHGLTTAVEAGIEIPTVSEPIRVFVFQTVREMLLNVVKHSGTMAARVGLFVQDGHLVVQVEDDGNGFDPQILKGQLEQPDSFGLFHIRERSEALGGRLEFDAMPGHARFRVMLPISAIDQPAHREPPRRSP